MKKTNILFIQPLFYNPTLPNFKDRFEMLSEKCCGHIVSVSSHRYEGLKFGEFTYHSLPQIKNNVVKYLYHLIRIVIIGIRANKAKRLDYIHSYDPLFFGLSATLIKLFTGSKLIIEVNGHLKEAAFLSEDCIRKKFKKAIFSFLIEMSLKNADIVKFINTKQEKEWKDLLGNKKIVTFNNFVPTHIFDPKKSKEGSYILFLGHPFHTKGVDVLIKAFLKISDKFPDIKLKIVGHCSDSETGREYYANMTSGNDRIKILRPVFYNEAAELVQNCVFFVLPSRSEGMGRVLIEAMSSGKAVIGSNVGGIPDIIEDNDNGFLFEMCDVDALALKMSTLLSDRILRNKMGDRGCKVVQERLSSRKYIENFFNMIEVNNA